VARELPRSLGTREAAADDMDRLRGMHHAGN
jgi:hypothetical protein